MTTIEPMRRNKEVGSSLETVVWVQTPEEITVPQFSGVDLSELFITGPVEVGPSCWDHGSSPAGFCVDDVLRDGNQWEVTVHADRTTHHKCGRCWRHLPEVTEDGALCSRCDQVVAGMDAPA